MPYIAPGGSMLTGRMECAPDGVALGNEACGAKLALVAAYSDILTQRLVTPPLVGSQTQEERAALIVHSSGAKAAVAESPTPS